MVALGEVHTAALRHSAAVSPDEAEQLLALVPGERVLVSEFPGARAIGPDVLTGVDCRLANRSGPRPRGIGTLSGHACLSGSRVLQATVSARIEPAGADRRRAWSHYLAKPGVVETLGLADPAGIAAAHLGTERSGSTMGIGAVAGRLLDRVQAAQHLDGRPPFTARRTVLRWVALEPAGSSGERIRLVRERDGLCTLWLAVSGLETVDVVTLCEDLALHDWLLTTLLALIDRSRIGTGNPAEMVAKLRPAVDHLLHLWLPAARLRGNARDIWTAVERSRGLSRHWEVSVQRVRDQLALSTALLLETWRNDREAFDQC